MKIAERFGQRPSAVKKWSAEEYDEAYIVWQGEQEYKVTPDDVKEAVKESAARNGGFLLDRSKNYWMRFVKDGCIDRAALLNRFRPEQAAWIEREMVERKWI